MDEPGQIEAGALVVGGTGRESADWCRPLPPGRARYDGWTPDRIRTFLTILSECGVVEDAARAAGMSVAGAYAFRNRAAGQAFHIAWSAAAMLGRRRLADSVQSRAMHGWTETIHRNGEVWGERNRFDNRLSLAVLARLDKQSEGWGQDSTIVTAAQDFEAFVDIVCRGGEEAAAFLEERDPRRAAANRLRAELEGLMGGAPDSDEEVDEEAGEEDDEEAGGEDGEEASADEILTSDLDPEFLTAWTEDQGRRALQSGLVTQLDPRQQDNFRRRFPQLES